MDDLCAPRRFGVLRIEDLVKTGHFTAPKERRCGKPVKEMKLPMYKAEVINALRGRVNIPQAVVPTVTILTRASAKSTPSTEAHKQQNRLLHRDEVKFRPRDRQSLRDEIIATARHPYYTPLPPSSPMILSTNARPKRPEAVALDMARAALSTGPQSVELMERKLRLMRHTISDRLTIHEANARGTVPRLGCPKAESKNIDLRRTYQERRLRVALGLEVSRPASVMVQDPIVLPERSHGQPMSAAMKAKRDEPKPNSTKLRSRQDACAFTPLTKPKTERRKPKVEDRVAVKVLQPSRVRNNAVPHVASTSNRF
ncbi:hypothetical protein BD626DRAFT_575347 [Schizophyllum amplum]|uniref:Uncharacterized protein n=1 Tax=Schizophyllum amplum TaxID=97359 RepID=A0A550BVX0_9AGAR|nr:hypothetical protein BD626DRAFT_575347 [Auriculariopsis ampla]